VYAEIFTMNGGEISDNTSYSYSSYSNSSYSYSYSYGGGVYAAETFTMSGGEISGNITDAATGSSPSHSYGGGVFARTSTMTGGEISGNTSTASGSFNSTANGGGVYVGSGTFTMTGGEISGNINDAAYGSGVYAAGGTFTVGGTAQIYGNTRDKARNNVYLANGQYITLGSGPDAPAYGMNVYVQTATASGVIVNTGATAEAVQYFHADNGKSIGYQSTQLQLVIMDIGVGSITAPPTLRENDEFSLITPPVAIPVGETVTAQGWQKSDDGSNGWSDFTPPSTAEVSYNNKYVRYYATSSGGQTYYSNTITIQIIARIVREFTIAMWDSNDDGWDNNSALRITVNGTDLSSNARLESGGGPGYYTFEVYYSGDIVRIYWVNGSQYDREIAFAMYYSDDPPTPAFDPSTGTNGGKVLISKRYDNPSGAVSNGTLMGTYTVP
jgi:hypothetical protein